MEFPKQATGLHSGQNIAYKSVKDMSKYATPLVTGFSHFVKLQQHLQFSAIEPLYGKASLAALLIPWNCHGLWTAVSPPCPNYLSVPTNPSLL